MKACMEHVCFHQESCHKSKNRIFKICGWLQLELFWVSVENIRVFIFMMQSQHFPQVGGTFSNSSSQHQRDLCWNWSGKCAGGERTDSFLFQSKVWLDGGTLEHNPFVWVTPASIFAREVRLLTFKQFRSMYYLQILFVYLLCSGHFSCLCACEMHTGTLCSSSRSPVFPWHHWLAQHPGHLPRPEHSHSLPFIKETWRGGRRTVICTHKTAWTLHWWQAVLHCATITVWSQGCHSYIQKEHSWSGWNSTDKEPDCWFLNYTCINACTCAHTHTCARARTATHALPASGVENDTGFLSYSFLILNCWFTS